MGSKRDRRLIKGMGNAFAQANAQATEGVPMITGMAVTVVDPEEMWKFPRRRHEDEAP
ncbi:hypothetical protein BH20ACT22_BH20ACT22_05630 [soil metagenome]